MKDDSGVSSTAKHAPARSCVRQCEGSGLLPRHNNTASQRATVSELR